MKLAAAVPTLVAGAAASTAFAWPVRVYWEDTDAGGVVFYANYLKFFERARTEWLRAAGFEQQNLRATEGGMFVVIEAALKYHQPARLDDQLLVTTWIQDAGRVCMTIGQQARRGPTAEGAVLCDATIRIGWVRSDSFKPARIPSSIVKALS
jgi:acyl-CoA thioester hydrolase